MGCFESKTMDEVPDIQSFHTKERIITGGTKKYVRAIAMDHSSKISFPQFTITYAFKSQRGYYPKTPHKANQDSFVCIENFSQNPLMALFAIFDGHGYNGEECATFARDQFPVNLRNSLKSSASVNFALEDALVTTNNQLHGSNINDSLSGTTAISILFIRDKIYVANVGDSRAILISKQEHLHIPKSLSIDQTPYRKDERERVRKCGARVLSIRQIEGLIPIHDNWGDIIDDEIDEGGDPPRIWDPEADYPGTAFTRSLGDKVAENFGVHAIPEILVRKIQPSDAYIVIASDGVFEFLTNRAVADIIKQYDDPVQACAAVVNQAYNLWLQFEVRTDDITVICLFISYTGKDEDVMGLGVDSLHNHPYPVDNTLKPVRRVGRHLMLSRKHNEHIITKRFAHNQSFDQIATDSQQNTSDEISKQYDEIDPQNYLVPKTEQEKAIIKKAVEHNVLFHHISEEQENLIIDLVKPIFVREGDIIIRQGEKGDQFYFVESGLFIVKVGHTDEEIQNADGHIVHEYETSHNIFPSFGELALIHSQPRAASVISKSEGKLWALDKLFFQKVISKSSRTELIKTLRKVELLKFLNLSQLQRLCDLLSETKFAPEQKIVEEGQVSSFFYVIKSGRVRVTCDGVVLYELGPHDYFAERALLVNAPRSRTVTAIEPTVCLALRKDVFEEVLGPLQQILEEVQHRQEVIKTVHHCNSILESPFFHDISQEAQSYENNFGKFILCNWKNKPCTLRSYKIDTSIPEKLLSDISSMVELSRSVSEFVGENQNLSRLLAIFQSKQSLHMLFDGHITFPLAFYMEQRDQYLSEDETRHIAVGIINGLRALHEINLAYRGVVPEMINLSIEGHAILNEFRSSKLETTNSSELYGYFEYFAPEQIHGEFDGESVDIWQLGVLIYEMLMGQTPFSIEGDENCEIQIYEQIKSFEPENLSFSGGADAFDLIQQLMQLEPQERLGAVNGVTTILMHSFFISGQSNDTIIQNPIQQYMQRILEKIFVANTTELKDVIEPIQIIEGMELNTIKESDEMESNEIKESDETEQVKSNKIELNDLNESEIVDMNKTNEIYNKEKSGSVDNLASEDN